MKVDKDGNLLWETKRDLPEGATFEATEIEVIDDGPIEAITATGAHPVQIVWFGVGIFL